MTYKFLDGTYNDNEIYDVIYNEIEEYLNELNPLQERFAQKIESLDIDEANKDLYLKLPVPYIYLALNTSKAINQSLIKATKKSKRIVESKKIKPLVKYIEKFHYTFKDFCNDLCTPLYTDTFNEQGKYFLKIALLDNEKILDYTISNLTSLRDYVDLLHDLYEEKKARRR